MGLLGAAFFAQSQPVINLSAPEVIEGDPLHINVTGLTPGQIVSVRASRQWPAFPSGEETYRASARFEANDQGVVDLGSSTPLTGSSYDRPDPSGLFWSMTRQKEEADDLPGTSAAAAVNEGEVLIEVESEGRVIARSLPRIRRAAQDVDVREIREPGVTGVFARNRDNTAQPVIIVLGGSEGGLFTARWATPILASRGYSVLGLAYYQGFDTSLSHLPASFENIPLETLSRARDWLSRQPGVDISRIAVVGISKGAELALVGSTVFPWVKVVGAFAPTHVVWEGIPPSDQLDRGAGSSWTFEGRPLPYVRWSRASERRSEATREATGSSRMTLVHLESLVEFAADIEAATIPVERSEAAMFIAAGSDDGLWPSAFSAEQLRARLARRRPEIAADFEIHPNGHLIMGTGWGPTTQFQRSTGAWLPGGNARLDAQAQQATWPALLAFLDRHLRPAVN